MNFSSKCFSHTCSLLPSIWRLRSASITRFLVIWFTHKSRVFFDKSSSPLGSLKILIPHFLRNVEHPKMLQLAPGMTVNGHKKQKGFEIQYGPILCYSMSAFVVHLRSDVTGHKREMCVVFQNYSPEKYHFTNLISFGGCSPPSHPNLNPKQVKCPWLNGSSRHSL